MTKQKKETPIEKKVEELEAALLFSQDALEEAQQGQLRALADLQNYQRRETENKKNWDARAIALFVAQLLPRFLELRMGSEHTEDKDVQKTVGNLFQALEKSGLTQISPQKGDPVDPNIHEVVMAEDGKDGCVVQVFEPGWQFKTQVITPAKISSPAN